MPLTPILASSSSTTQRPVLRCSANIDISNFIIDSAHLASQENPVCHKVYIGRFKDSTQRWFCKEIHSPAQARLELLAQEYFRLILPHQPKTLLAVNPLTNTHYILSQEIPGFKPFPRYKQTEFNQGHFPGLAAVSAIALFIEEIDFKNGNVGCDDFGNVFKIDGDCCFSELEDRFATKNFAMTVEILYDLPFARGFFSFNWLDCIAKQRPTGRCNIVPPSISRQAYFRNELHHTLLKLALVPPQFHSNLVDSYMPCGGERYLTFLLNRQQLLISCLRKMPLFQQYLASPQAQQTLYKFKQQMLAMIANNTDRVATENTAKNIDYLTQRQLLITDANRYQLLHHFEYHLNQNSTAKSYYSCYYQALYKNDSQAQIMLGDWFSSVLTTPQNHEVAFNWYQLAANNGHPLAPKRLTYYARQHRCQTCYYQVNASMARSLMKQGDTKGVSYLAKLYRHKLIPFNYTQASANNKILQHLYRYLNLLSRVNRTPWISYVEKQLLISRDYNLNPATFATALITGLAINRLSVEEQQVCDLLLCVSNNEIQSAVDYMTAQTSVLKLAIQFPQHITTSQGFFTSATPTQDDVNNVPWLKK